MHSLDRSIIEHRLPIKSRFRPHQQPARQCNPNILPDIKAKITKLIEAKFIRQCRYAEWISNVVPIYKKNGKLCVFINFRSLNKATPMDGYPMPVVDMLVDACRCFPHGGSRQRVNLYACSLFQMVMQEDTKIYPGSSKRRPYVQRGREVCIILHISACTGANTSVVWNEMEYGSSTA